jgi:hypothetical protein
MWGRRPARRLSQIGEAKWSSACSAGPNRSEQVLLSLCLEEALRGYAGHGDRTRSERPAALPAGRETEGSGCSEASNALNRLEAMELRTLGA